MDKEAGSIGGADGDKDARLLNQPVDAQGCHCDEPDEGDGAEDFADALGAALDVAEDAAPEALTTSDLALDIGSDVDGALLDAFMNDSPPQAAEVTQSLSGWIADSTQSELLRTAKRAAHTLKGSANILGIRGVAKLAHRLEDVLEICEADACAPSPHRARALMSAADCLAQMVAAVAGEDVAPDNTLAVIAMLDAAEKPVIAAVNGLCFGGGVEIVAACDLAVAADHAEFSLPEPKVGLAALGGGGLQRLVRQMPMKEAMSLALTGKRIDAVEARRIGLINEVVPSKELRARARAIADEILVCAPLAVEATKQVMLLSLAEPDLQASMRKTYPAAVRMLASEDAREGSRAFAEKRKPLWQGK